MRCVQALMVGSVLLVTTTAVADEHSFFGSDDTSSKSASGITPTTQGVYLGGGLGYGDESNDSGSNSGWAGGINGGYQFNPNIAAEAGFTWLPSDSAKALGIVSAKTDFYLFDIAVKPMVYVNNRFSIYGKFGLAIQTVSSSVSVAGVGGDASDNYGALYLGGGLAYNITNQFQVVGDLAASLGSKVNTFSALGGVNYLFAAG